MMASQLLRSITETLRKVCKSVPFQATLCFFIMYTCLTIFSLPLLLLVFYRLILSVMLKFLYKGKLKLMGSYAAVCSAMDSFAGIFNLTCFIYVDGNCDIQKLRNRVFKRIMTKDEKGNRPFGILLKSPVDKFGFICFNDKSETIDFKNHVRLCPGVDDPDKVYGEQEFLDAVANLADCDWDEGKPQWEILIAPQVKREDSDEITTGIAVKCHHLYVDGISLVQLIRNCVLDQPAPKLIMDPVNPPLPNVPLYQKILLWLQTFFMGPYICLRLCGNDYDPGFTEGPFTGGKLFGRTKMTISLEMMRQIRKLHNCSTQAILHSAFIGSFQKMAKKKGIQLPDEIISGITFANFPYPDEFPNNHMSVAFEPININIQSSTVRLDEMNKCMKTVNSRVYALKASEILITLIGIHPAALVRMNAQFFKVAYYMSNIPGTQEKAIIDGKDVGLMYGSGALFNRVRYHAGVAIYRGIFRVLFLVEASKIISNREELEEWIQEYEKEIKYLDMRAKVE